MTLNAYELGANYLISVQIPAIDTDLESSIVPGGAKVTNTCVCSLGIVESIS